MRKAATHNDFEIEFDHAGPDEGRQSFVRRLLGQSPGARIGAAGLAAMSLAIVVNALLLQDQRHAAPLFQMNLHEQPSAATVSQAVPPLPAPRPVELSSPQPARTAPVQRVDTMRVDPIGKEIARLDQQAARAEAAPRIEKPKAVEAKPVEARHADAIGGLIRNAGIATQTASDPDTSVVAAQRALMKLGFVLRPDGVFGGTTRQAIERFERDNRMPVRGELTPKVKAELARQSGMEIE